MPTFEVDDDQTDVELMWLARLAALIGETGNLHDQSSLRIHQNRLGSRPYHEDSVQKIKSMLFRALAWAELGAPARAQGSFVAASSPLDAFATISKVIAEAKSDLLIVDPYLDQTVLTDFAISAPEGVTIRLLADGQNVYPTLSPAAARFRQQYGAKRPLDVRISAPRALHDRAIFVDKNESWQASQSFKDFAQRSPATLSRLTGDAGIMKFEAYEALWLIATDLA